MSYKQTKENTIRVYKHRGHYDYETVHSIIEDSHVVHVAFQRPDGGQLENQPMIGTMGYMLEKPVLYIHGNAASMIYKGTKAEEQSLPVCITATQVDGVVFAYTPNGHALNYRSTVIHGRAGLVTDEVEKRYALKRIFEQMLPERWDHTAPLKEEAVRGVNVFRVTIDSASAKIAKGMTDPGPAVDGVFAGIVPLYRKYGEPRHVEGKEVPQHIRELVKARSEAWREYSVTQSREGK